MWGHSSWVVWGRQPVQSSHLFNSAGLGDSEGAGAGPQDGLVAWVTGGQVRWR